MPEEVGREVWEGLQALVRQCCRMVPSQGATLAQADRRLEVMYGQWMGTLQGSGEEGVGERWPCAGWGRGAGLGGCAGLFLGGGSRCMVWHLAGTVWMAVVPYGACKA